MLRCDVAKTDKWSIEDIYEDDAAWQSDYDCFADELNKGLQYRGRLADSAQTLLDAIKIYDELDEKAEKIYVYAYMRLYEDMSDAASQGMAQKAQSLVVKFASEYSFIEPEILAIDENILRGWMNGNLGHYTHMIEDIILEKPHTLSADKEQLLAQASVMQSAPKDIFSQFNNSDIRFADITDENGESASLTNGVYGRFMESSDRRVRKEAFESLYREYAGHINMLAAAYTANLKQAGFYAGVRNYGSSLEMYLSQNNIPVNVYTNLIDTVNRRMELMHRYVRLRKRALGVDELHMYDVYAPMVPDYSMKVGYDEAKEMVLEGMRPLGEHYGRILREGFDGGWIDVRENQGKRSGAYSWGEYGTHPYVSLNYSDRLDDVFTLAHEMGHAIHTYHSNKKQPHVYAGYRIFVAEVASTCNEVLLMRSLLEKCTDNRERKYLLNHFLEQFKGTLFRQTMFAEFEMQTHEALRNGEALGAQDICNIYRKLNEKYFGSDMVLDKQIEYEWARIPHFYTPFYVYQYATGFSAAIAIARSLIDGYKKGDDSAREGYFRFLSGGSSMHPIELLKLCGIDMTSPAPVEAALDVFEELLDEFENGI
ncbi:putative uncharacterized protein [Bacteroides pectinophilus CAG:437]|uniref:Oligopeptidase F n=1 Tax=Bacteroides pectinophilus CAG:437 TaxID=1263051 RepID=R7AS39_9FIRM|nr:putative uncharacterized protein [Bacteroides pectinophilus CAG:437]